MSINCNRENFTTFATIYCRTYNFGNMKMQIRDKNFKLIAERERPSKVKAPTTFIHTIRRIGDKPALTPFVKDFSL